MWGVLVNLGPGGIWFLHRCLYDSHTFQYNPDPESWHKFATIEEARIWFLRWYKQRKDANKWMPDKRQFRIQEIPETINNKVGNIFQEETEFRTIC